MDARQHTWQWPQIRMPCGSRDMSSLRVERRGETGAPCGSSSNDARAVALQSRISMTAGIGKREAGYLIDRTAHEQGSSEPTPIRHGDAHSQGGDRLGIDDARRWDPCQARLPRRRCPPLAPVPGPQESWARGFPARIGLRPNHPGPALNWPAHRSRSVATRQSRGRVGSDADALGR
jgi:hypothetical protein